MAQLCKVSTEDVETHSAMVKLAQEIDESARQSERVLTRNGGDVEKDAVALDEVIVELRNVHQFNDSIITSRCVQYPVRRTVRQER